MRRGRNGGARLVFGSAMDAGLSDALIFPWKMLQKSGLSNILSSTNECLAKQTVARFDLLPCNYGGGWFWFLCTHCDRRIAVLHGAGDRFLCPTAKTLSTPARTKLSWTTRYICKARRIRERLEVSGDLTKQIWQNSKGMYWKTFLSLVREKGQSDIDFRNSGKVWDI